MTPAGSSRRIAIQASVVLLTLPLLLLWRSYSVFDEGVFRVQASWGAWEYLNCYAQDLLAWAVFVVIWRFGLTRLGTAGTVITLLIANLLLMMQVIDGRIKVQFLQALTPWLIGFFFEEADRLMPSADLFTGRRFWPAVVVSHLMLSSPILLLALPDRLFAPLTVRLARLARLGAVKPQHVLLALVASLALFWAARPAPYGLDRNVFVSAAVDLAKPVATVRGHQNLKTEQPVKQGFRPSDRPELGDKRFRNVVVFVAESTSYAAAFGGQDAPRWPYLASLADRGAAIVPCYSQFPVSTKALYTLLTGRYGAFTLEVLESQLRAVNSLARVLGERGYHSAFVSGQDLVYQGQRSQTANMGYDRVWEYSELVELGRKAGMEIESTGFGAADDALMMLVELDQLSADQPFFLTYYSTSSHYPYDFPGNGDGTDYQRYLRSLEYTDQVVERLERILEEKGLADDTLLVVTSDHGETFNPDGSFRGRGGLISDHTHRVPLVIYAPGVDLREIAVAPARHVDIVPTVLDLMRLESDLLAFQGTSLLEVEAERPVLLHNYSEIRLSAVVEGDTTYVHSFSTGATWQFPSADASTEDSRGEVSEDSQQRIVERLTEFADYNEAYLRDAVAAQQTW